MVDIYSNAFWQKSRESAKRHLANQRGCSVEEAVAQAIRLKEWTKNEMEKHSMRKY